MLCKKLVLIAVTAPLALGAVSSTQEGVCSAPGQSSMSVEGVKGVYCVTGQACAGQDGACPGAQAGLPYGASCDKVASGVLGCKANAVVPLAAVSLITATKTAGNGTLVIEIKTTDS